MLSYFGGQKFVNFNSSSSEFYSKRKLNQTVEEFFQAIDDVIEKTGMRKADVERKVKQLEATGGEERITYKDELDKQMIPIYRELRKAGYNHLDIVK